MQNLDKQIWKSRITIPTKLKLYNTCILPIFLYGNQCWAVTKRNVLKIDTLEKWCLQKLLGIKWYHHVLNDEVRRTTRQPCQQDLRSNNLSLDEAITVAQNRPLWRLMSAFGTTHPLWCLPHKKKKKKNSLYPPTTTFSIYSIILRQCNKTSSLQRSTGPNKLYLLVLFLVNAQQFIGTKRFLVSAIQWLNQHCKYNAPGN